MKTAVIFASLVVSSLAASLPFRCKVVSKTCKPCVCGEQSCFERIECCATPPDGSHTTCTVRSNTSNECCPFECQNGGTKQSLKGRRAVTVSASESLADYVCPAEIPPPRCSCPIGFEGRCCQTENPCAGFECDDGKECKVYYSGVRAEPYCADRCGDETCPFGQMCVRKPVVCVSAPCQVQSQCVPGEKPGACPPLKPGLITICPVECYSDSDCSGREKCCSIGCHIKCTYPVFY